MTQLIIIILISGESPYNEVKTSGIWDVMISYLKAGNRLEQPMDCPDILYVINLINIMLSLFLAHAVTI